MLHIELLYQVLIDCGKKKKIPSKVISKSVFHCALKDGKNLWAAVP